MIKWTRKNRGLWWIIIFLSIGAILVSSYIKSKNPNVPSQELVPGSNRTLTMNDQKLEGFQQDGSDVDPRDLLYMEKESKIPNIIWTFWDDKEMPIFVEKCIGSWKKHNSDYIIIVLNRKNIGKYLPETDLSKIRGTNDSVQRFSDFVRLHILLKYGGFWLDASIICQKPLTWVHKKQLETDAEYIGYYIDKMTLPEYKEKSPIIENWCFACVARSKYMNDWLFEFTSLTKFNSPTEYVQSVKKSGTNIQKIEWPEYLAMHVAAQKILQSPTADYKLFLMRAEDTAFKHMVDDNGKWDDEHAVNRIIQKKHSDQPILKMIGYIRNQIISKVQNYDQLFI